MKLHRKLLIIAAISMVLGLAGLVPLAHYHLQTKRALAHPATISVPAVAPQPALTPTLLTGKPAHLIIPSLNIDLTVADGVYNTKDGSWTLSRDKAHYALPTVQPNNKEGNTLIYGHYRPEVFAKLHKIAPGAQVAIDTDTGYRFTYTFQKKETVSPTDTSIFTYQGEPRLTLQTCTGAFMQHRQLYYFTLTTVDKLK